MSNKAFVPQIWSTKIFRTLEDNLIAKKICTMEYEGEIKKAGDTVFFNGFADPTISDYTGTVSYEALVSGQMAMKIGKQKYFAFEVTDLEKAQMNVDGKNSQATRAAYGLKDAADALVLGSQTYNEISTTNSITDATCDTASILSTIGEAGVRLDDVNVTDGKRWLVIPPWVKLKLQLAGIKFNINEGINGTGGMAWCKELGFDIYVSNNLTKLAATPQHVCLAGSYNSIAYADQIVETETIRLQTKFADAVRGLHVYDFKVIKPTELVKLTLTYAAETTI